MRSILGKLILAPAILAAAALTTNTAMAESNVKVPFSFTAAGKVWPAGEYSIQKDMLAGTVTLKSNVTLESFSYLLGPGDPAPTDSHITLRFDDVGGTHALRSIQYGPQITAQLDRQQARDADMAASGR